MADMKSQKSGNLNGGRKYAVFDMDGTLIDSMVYWDRLGAEYLRSRGVNPDREDLQAVESMTMAESAAYFRQRYSLPDPIGKIISDMNAMMDRHYREDIPLKPGTAGYLEKLSAAGIKSCVATATDPGLARDCLGRLGVLPEFDFVISCETIGISKKKPDIYLQAAQIFRDIYGKEGPGENGDIAVYEDADYCIRTAKNVGFYTIAIYEPAYSGSWEKSCRTADLHFRNFKETVKKGEGL